MRTRPNITYVGTFASLLTTLQSGDKTAQLGALTLNASAFHPQHFLIRLACIHALP